MCSPRGVIEEFARLKEAITQAAGAQGETGYGEILRRHGVENSSQFKSSQPARLCAKELFQAIQSFQQAAATNGVNGIAEGPALGHVLTLAEDAWLAADFPLDQAALKTIADRAAARFTRDHRL